MDATPQTEEEAEARKQQLIEETREAKRELDQAQSEALDQIASGGDLEKFETVELGELELEVKAWLPGDVADTVEKAQRLADGDDVSDVRESMETMLDALSSMTVDAQYGTPFWEEFYSRYGPTGLMLAVETVLEPAQEEIENKRDAMDGFRPDVGGPRPGVGDGEDGE